MTAAQLSFLTSKGINHNLAFSIFYMKKDGTINQYTVRGGVTQWTGMDGEQNEVLGTRRQANEQNINLFCFTRKCYRQFIQANIISMTQGNVAWHNPEIISQPINN